MKNKAMRAAIVAEWRAIGGLGLDHRRERQPFGARWRGDADHAARARSEAGRPRSR